jgi:hypothetical protein
MEFFGSSTIYVVLVIVTGKVEGKLLRGVPDGGLGVEGDGVLSLQPVGGVLGLVD